MSQGPAPDVAFAAGVQKYVAKGKALLEGSARGPTRRQFRAIQTSRGSVVVHDCKMRWTSPASIIERIARRLGSGIVPVKAPIGSTSWPVSYMNGEARAADWVAMRYGAPKRAFSSRGRSGKTVVGTAKNMCISYVVTCGWKGESKGPSRSETAEAEAAWDDEGCDGVQDEERAQQVPT